MAGSDSKEATTVPAWQQKQQQQQQEQQQPPSPSESLAAAPEPTQSNTEDSSAPTLDHARRFLQDDNVRLASRDAKAAFLRTKGVSDADIDTLLLEHDAARSPDPTITANTTTTTTTTAAAAAAAAATSQPKADTPPIVTYPEFLTKPPPPPPLVTPATFLNAASVAAGLAAAVVGVSRFVLAPMAESLTDARVDLHRSAGAGLARVVSRLEQVVSQVPPPPPPHAARADPDDHDAASTDSDPTELFHRDVGVQTSPLLPDSPAHPPPPQQQTTSLDGETARLATLTASLRDMSAQYAAQADGNQATRAVLDQLDADLDRLKAPMFRPALAGAYRSLYAEPDDDVKTVKQSIRSVKGVLLSARTFPPPSSSSAAAR